ncbi:MAG TPA: hypothetical protein VFV75_07750 [Candidatus Polarisedimenticolaceae bacterium]|nr:hypothetical protein [Candidatus Polarisedimenticolaceae bacterium]
MNAQRSGVLALLAAFALGIVTGASLLHLWHAERGFPGPPPPRQPPLVHLQRELHLTPEQSTRIRAVLEEGRSTLHDQAESVRAHIREVLTPEQRSRFDAMRPPPPPPPPFAPPPPPPPGD